MEKLLCGESWGDTLAKGTVCGLICVAFMWAYMSFSMHTMEMQPTTAGMHQMPDGSMMMNDGSTMNMMDMTMSDMGKMMQGKTGKALEKEFIVGMIPHHQGAVDMARMLVADPTVSPRMKQFGYAIIAAQEKEIEDMREWLKAY